MIRLWMMAIVPIAVVTAVAIIGLWGARRVRRDIFRLARVEEEEEDRDG